MPIRSRARCHPFRYLTLCAALSLALQGCGAGADGTDITAEPSAQNIGTSAQTVDPATTDGTSGASESAPGVAVNTAATLEVTQAVAPTLVAIASPGPGTGTTTEPAPEPTLGAASSQAAMAAPADTAKAASETPAPDPFGVVEQTPEPPEQPASIDNASTDNSPEAVESSSDKTITYPDNFPEAANAPGTGSDVTALEPDVPSEKPVTTPDSTDTSEPDTSEPDTSDPESARDLEITQIEITQISGNSARVEWSATAPVDGQVFYGTSPGFGSETRKEESFQYDAHAQPLTGLQAGTEYHVQAVSSDAQGHTAVSDTVTFKTLADPTPEAETPTGSETPGGETSGGAVAGWPAQHDQNLPMAGIFYGNHQAGARTGNSRIAIHNARRFRAERSGLVNAFRYNNRTLQNGTITGRCANDNVWCKCKNAGLDNYTCGYTLGNSYSVGNGGQLIFELRADDGTSAHQPGATVLATTSRPFVPVDNAGDQYPTIVFDKPASLTAGALYHLVYRNIAPPSRCGFGGVDPAQAGSCPRNEGAIGLNGVSFPSYAGSDSRFGPFRGESASNLYRNSNSGSWTVDSDNLSWFELRYDDNVWVGDMMAAYNAIYDSARQVIEGSRVGRQVFTVRDATREVDGLWLNYGHTPGGSNGSPLAVTVKDGGGRTLATGTLASASGCSNADNQGSFEANECRTWGYTALSTPVSLLEGSNYSVEFRAGSGGGYVMSTFFPLNYGAANSNERGFWHSAHAEISTDGGSSWTKWAGNYYDQRDLGLLFTTVGKPRQLP